MAGIKGKTGNPGQPRHWAGPGRPKDETRVFDSYGVRAPLSILFEAIAERYGDQAAADLKAIYDAAHQRYERAYRLLTFKREVRRGPSVMMSETKIARRQRVLDDHQAYINGEIDLLEE